MTTLTTSRLRRYASPTVADRLLLTLARTLEEFAVAHMERRASAVGSARARAWEDYADQRRVREASAQLGLMPR